MILRFQVARHAKEDCPFSVIERLDYDHPRTFRRSRCAQCLLSRLNQMVRPDPDVTHVPPIALHWMRIRHQLGRRDPDYRPVPSMRFGMPVRKRQGSGFFVVKRPWRRKVGLRVSNGNLEWRKANAERFGLNENEQLGRLSELRIAFVKRYGWDGSVLLHTSVQIIVHRIAA